MPTIRPWSRGHRTRRIHSRHLLACALTFVLVGCGQADDSDSTSAEATAPSPQKTQASDVDSSVKAMGIDTVEWPGNVQDADALFSRMPDQLAGAPVERWKSAGSTGIAYGSAKDAATAWAMSATKATKTPERTLAVMFGPGVACEKGTYSGTVPEAPYGGGPALARTNAAGDGLQWYACTMATGEAEGDSKHTAHAVGWISGELGWLTTSPDERTASSLIEALIAAR